MRSPWQSITLRYSIKMYPTLIKIYEVECGVDSRSLFHQSDEKTNLKLQRSYRIGTQSNKKTSLCTHINTHFRLEFLSWKKRKCIAQTHMNEVVQGFIVFTVSRSFLSQFQPQNIQKKATNSSLGIQCNVNATATTWLLKLINRASVRSYYTSMQLMQPSNSNIQR